MPDVICNILMTAVILSIAIMILTYIKLAFHIKDKLKRNHFKNRIWHPILHGVFVIFVVDGVTLLADMVHAIVHSYDIATVHWWFIPAYVLRAIAVVWFYTVLKVYSGAFDEDTKMGE